MNSFRAVQRAIQYEIDRQIDLVEEDGEEVVPETRTWDEEKGITLPMRKKENPDYRGIPEPDVPPIEVTQEWVDKIKASLPELPEAKKKRLIEEHALPAYDAGIITSSLATARFFDEAVAQYPDAKIVSNWIMGEMLRLVNANNIEFGEVKVTPIQLTQLLKLIDKGTISGKIAKQIFEEMFSTGKDPEAIVKEKGLVQISDEGQIGAFVDEVIAANPNSVSDFKAGKEKAIGFLVGQVMKKTKGQANPGLVNKLLKEKLAKL